MKIGMVLEGGAMRGMYTAGVLDVFLDKDVKVDGIIGVPVFILSASKPKETSCSVIPVLALSEILPPENDFSPINIRPLRNVPFVNMTVFE